MLNAKCLSFAEKSMIFLKKILVLNAECSSSLADKVNDLCDLGAEC